MSDKKSVLKRARAVRENRIFRTKPSRLFQQPQRVVENPPTVDRVRDFWGGLYGEVKPLDLETSALAHFAAFCDPERQELGTAERRELRTPITVEEVQAALRGAKNFTAPGPDGIKSCYGSFWAVAALRLIHRN